MASKDLFKIKTPLGFSVRCSKSYWEFIVNQKHPSLIGKEEEIKLVLSDPDEVRTSKKNHGVKLFYRGEKPRWLCAVVKNEDDENGFLITAYLTDSIKAGEKLWIKSK
jgi:hypothetical protein